MAIFFKKGSEFNKVAHCFGNMYSLINQLQPILEIYTDNLEEFKTQYKTDILILAHIANRGIISRMDEYNWGLEAKIMIPVISLKRITIMYAWNLTITKMSFMIGLLELQDEYDEITNNGPICQLLEKVMPPKFKNW
ncbi:MAG: hypothetical protein ACQERU_13330 [Bacteroidota bacterium]